MIRFLTFPMRLPPKLLKALYQLSRLQRTKGRNYPYYAFPAAMALLATFLVIRMIVTLWPGLGVQINGIHVHHFVWGILILAASGFWAICDPSGRTRYMLAMAWGSGVAFVLDEFYPWLHLDDAAALFSRYDAVIYGAAVLVFAILTPAVIDGFSQYRRRHDG